ncbi:MAG: hypothetical protein HQK51_16120 [Oligoflexia bacterium]|nr:hypothetical protein [Oligoflexia bacterium]
MPCQACERNGSCPEHPGDKNLYINAHLNINLATEEQKIVIYADSFDIARAMEDQNNEIESFYHLDIETGEVKYFTHDISYAVESSDDGTLNSLPEWQQDEVKTVREIWADDSVRYVSIPRMDSSESFRHMEKFVEFLEESGTSDIPITQLTRVLSRSRPFRGFKDVLEEHPVIEKQWYDFKSVKMVEAVEEFLQGIEHDKIEVRILK